MENNYKSMKNWFLKDLIKAVTKYKMINNGDRVTVALSGGKDSVTMLYMLYILKKQSHINFELSAIHIKTSNYDTSNLKEFAEKFETPYYDVDIEFENSKDFSSINKNSICYWCSKVKRGALLKFANQLNIDKIAFGHHADDVAETFLMNIIQNRKLGSFSPKVIYDNQHCEIVRPMIYIRESKISEIHSKMNLPTLKYRCPFESENIRGGFKEKTKEIEKIFEKKDFVLSLINSLENIDETNIWKNLILD
ncbi:tRNA 2-thiocytidine biosynthesis protein TtcA [bacterium]|nr:tRNA 2-thiocytidine biosynthesis protein TtcA [bacterium]